MVVRLTQLALYIVLGIYPNVRIPIEATVMAMLLVDANLKTTVMGPSYHSFCLPLAILSMLVLFVLLCILRLSHSKAREVVQLHPFLDFVDVVACEICLCYHQLLLILHNSSLVTALKTRL